MNFLMEGEHLEYTLIIIKEEINREMMPDRRKILLYNQNSKRNHPFVKLVILQC